jgi:alpha-N-arabinofuranosidase
VNTSPARSASVNIQPDRTTKTYSRDLFGHFIEHFHRQVYGGIFEPGSPLSDERGFRQDVIAALRELHVPVVRWPGGCFVSGYHWQDGIGPERTPVFDRAWRVTDPNTFGTDEFVAWCREIGAEPYICTNAGTGTGEEMADWLEYCNSLPGSRWADRRAGYGNLAPHAVRYWSIGNENYGAWELGARTPGEWGHYVAEAAKMMRRTDPTVKLLAAAVDDVDWTIPLLNAAGRYLDYVSIHGYWDHLNEVNEPSDYLQCMAFTALPEAQIAKTEAILVAMDLKDQVSIAFDEWNLRGWHHPKPTDAKAIAARDLNDLNATYTMADAIFSAVFLNTCLRHAGTVRMANIAPTVNARGPLFVHRDGIVRRSTFHVLRLYASLLGPEVLDSHTIAPPLEVPGGSVPAIDVISTRRNADSSIIIAFVNKHDREPVSCNVVIGSGPINGTFDGTLLTAPTPDAYNDVDSPDEIQPVDTRVTVEDGVLTLPPHSVLFVTFPC